MSSPPRDGSELGLMDLDDSKTLLDEDLPSVFSSTSTLSASAGAHFFEAVSSFPIKPLPLAYQQPQSEYSSPVPSSPPSPDPVAREQFLMARDSVWVQPQPDRAGSPAPLIPQSPSNINLSALTLGGTSPLHSPTDSSRQSYASLSPLSMSEVEDASSLDGSSLLAFPAFLKGDGLLLSAAGHQRPPVNLMPLSADASSRTESHDTTRPESTAMPLPPPLQAGFSGSRTPLDASPSPSPGMRVRQTLGNHGKQKKTTMIRRKRSESAASQLKKPAGACRYACLSHC